MRQTVLGALGLGLAMAAGVVGCNTLLGNSSGENVGDDAGSGGPGTSSGGPGGPGSSGGDAGEDLVSLDLECDPNERAPDDAIFLAPSGDDTQSGSAQAPKRSLVAALDLVAKAGSVRPVVLAEGLYEEALGFGAEHAGVLIRGGWVQDGTSWRRNCAAGMAARTTIGSVQVDSATSGDDSEGAAPITLEALTILAADAVQTPAPPDGQLHSVSQSSYGVFVASGRVSLRGVAVKAGQGASGSMHTVEAVGTRDCKPALTDGQQVIPYQEGDDGSDADVPGSYTTGGFVPSNGHDGTNGSDGGNGRPGTPTQELQRCANCHGECEQYPYAPAGIGQPPVYEAGPRGCGGRGGLGALGSGGGGASIAVFVSAHARLELERVRLVTAAGGEGAGRSPGGKGGDQSAGEPGWLQCYPKSNGGCGSHPDPADPSSDICRGAGALTLLTSTASAGTAGQPGLSGGGGGAGAGGDSIGLVVYGVGGEERVSLDRVEYDLGPAGAGGASAATTTSAGRSGRRAERLFPGG